MDRDVDRGWAWVVLGASALNLSLMACFNVAVGLFQVEFQESFTGSSGLIALIGALAASGQSLMGPVAGIVSSVLSARVTIMLGGGLLCVGLVTASFSTSLTALLLLFGILSGCAFGLCYTPAVTVVSVYFHKYRTVANGVSLAAPGVGVMSAPFLLRWLMENTGWRYAMVIMGCLMAQMCVLGALCFPMEKSHTSPSSFCRCCKKQDVDSEPEEEKFPVLENPHVKQLKREYDVESREDRGSRLAIHMTEFGSALMSKSIVYTIEEIHTPSLKQRLKALLHSRFLWVMALNQLLLWSGFSINSILFPAYARSVGISSADIPSIFTVYGVTMIVSRIAGGFIFSAIPSQHLIKVYFALLLGVALELGLLPVYGTTLPALYVYKFLIGVTYGPAFLLLTPLLIHHVGLEELSVAFGIIMLCCGLGYIVAPTLGGVMYDSFGDYSVTYYFAGSLIGAGALSILLLLLCKDSTVPITELKVKQQPLLQGGASQTPVIDSNGESADHSALKHQSNGSSLVHVIKDMEDLHHFVNERHS